MKDLSIFKDVSVTPCNAELFEFLANYARSKDVPVYAETGRDSYNKGFIHLWFNDGMFIGASSLYVNNISVEKFIALCDEWANNDDVKLNSNYTAKIDRVNKIVHVGCQMFTFESISNLHRAICNKV
jgi:hypothetical protein